MNAPNVGSLSAGDGCTGKPQGGRDARSTATRAMCRRAVIVAAMIAALGTSAIAQKSAEPEHFRGEITAVEAGAIVVKSGNGASTRITLSDSVAIFKLTKGSFTEVDFGTYVGAVSVKLGDEIYSPIRRDSLSWLYRGFELRIIDEDLRGIAVGHSKWDLTAGSVMTHGWVDDMEGRVISIKYGPTEEEETDVEISRDTPVFRMLNGDRKMLKPGARVLAAAEKKPGNYAAVFVFVGANGAVPGL